MSGRGVEEEKGGAIPTAYTRSSMDTGILGSTHRVQLDAITAEAESALVAAAEKLESLAHDLHVAYRETVADASPGGSAQVLQRDAHLLAPSRALLGRLELADRQLQDVAKTIKSRRLPPRTTRPALDPGGRRQRARIQPRRCHRRFQSTSFRIALHARTRAVARRIALDRGQSSGRHRGSG